MASVCVVKGHHPVRPAVPRPRRFPGNSHGAAHGPLVRTPVPVPPGPPAPVPGRAVPAHARRADPMAVILTGVLLAALGLVPPAAPAAQSLHIRLRHRLKRPGGPGRIGHPKRRRPGRGGTQRRGRTGRPDHRSHLPRHPKHPHRGQGRGRGGHFRRGGPASGPGLQLPGPGGRPEAQALGSRSSRSSPPTGHRGRGDLVFSICFDDHARPGHGRLRPRDLGARTAAILTDLTSAYGLAMVAAFRERFTALGGGSRPRSPTRCASGTSTTNCARRPRPGPTCCSCPDTGSTAWP
jgi:hypothetical protein